MSNLASSIDSNQQAIIVRLDRDRFDHNSLMRFLDYLDLEMIRQKSALTPEHAAHLANEIDQSVWQTVRPLFEQE